MKRLQNLIQYHIFVVFVLLFCLDSYSQTSWISPDLLHVSFGGECTQESFMSTNLNLLNAQIPQDSVGYLRATLDYFVHSKYGQKERPCLDMYVSTRFRYYWGSSTLVTNADSSVALVNSNITVPGTSVNKHLLWMRESWLKVMIGSDLEKQHFIQIGMIPYEVGRGISLGAAYDNSGFLGFTPGFSIDQYATAFLLNFQLTNKSKIDFYIALLENEQTNLDEIFQPIRLSELHGCDIRGIGHQSYIVSVRNKTIFENDKKYRWTLEPYLVHQQAPDKHFEFKNDVDSSLSTCGLCVEADYGRLTWGFEIARNFGDVYIKPWDRNSVSIVKKDTGSLVERYTKIYNQDPTNSTAQLVDATTANAVFVQGSPDGVSANGQQIGPNLFNAIDRFRPAQNINLNGYFFIADLAYEYIPKVLTWGLGMAYVSGGIHHQQDMNHAISPQCLNQNFTGFVPLQSIYSGDRIRHFVLLNQGVPRFTVANLGVDSSAQNLTPSISIDSINTLTNIAFLGTRLAWNPTSWQKHKLLLAPNIIFYWAPETSHVVAGFVGNKTAAVQPADNYLGTEFNIEFAAQIIENLKLEGYVGILLPGDYYKSICGTIVKEFDKPIGHDMAYVGNFGIIYSF